MRILLVEDEENFRRALERWFIKMGHTMCWASTGYNAIRLLCSEKVDVVILDILLGQGMSGWDVARFKHMDPQLRSIPLIVMSGLGSAYINEGARTNVLEGAKIVLSKPIDMHILETVLNDIATQAATKP